MQINPLEGQLERLARTLTEEYGVQVVCQGDEAWTNGRQIVLPSVPDPMNEALERMIVGFLDHEMGHVAFSEFKEVGEFSAKHPGREALLNVVEDARIERCLMERWPGVRANLDAMFAQIRDRVIALIQQRDGFGRFCTAVYLKLSHHNDMLGLDGQINGYDDLFALAPSLKDTHDGAMLSERILERWLQNQPPESSSPTPNANEPNDAGDQTTESEVSSGGRHTMRRRFNTGKYASSKPKQMKPPGLDEKVAGLPVENDAKAESDDSKRSDDAHQRHQKPQEPAKPDSTSPVEHQNVQPAAGGRGGFSPSLVTEALAESIAELVRKGDASREYRPFTTQYDRVDLLPVADESEVRELLAHGGDVVRRLRRGLANALRSAEKRWWREDQTRGELSPRTLYRLCTDQQRVNVFRTRGLVQGCSTAVSLLLDASGSMTSNKMAVARDAVRVIAEDLSDLHIAFEALTFTTGHEFDMDRACKLTGEQPLDLQARYGRFGNLVIGVVKRFDEPVKLALRRLPSVHGTGLTPLGEALLVAARRLVVRRETRRILLVFTDGRPGCESHEISAFAQAQRVAERIAKSGIELVGVGIQEESLRQIVVDTIVVQQPEDLPAQLCKLLGRTLLKGLRHVG